MPLRLAHLALPEGCEVPNPAWRRGGGSLQRRLAALDQLRKITAGKVAGQADAEKAKEYGVKLRVVV